MTKLHKIGDRLINLSNITYIVDRTVHFNNGVTWVALEPEIQDLLALMFETPRVEVEEEPLVIKKKAVKRQ